VRRVTLGCFAMLLASCMPHVDEADRRSTLVVARFTTPASVDPALAASALETPVIDATYEQLVAIMPKPGGGAQIEGELAESWVVSPDGKAITFRLKSGRRFADGRPIDAEAVKYSFDRAKRIGRGGAAYLTWLSSVGVQGPDEVRLQLVEPYAPALEMLAHPAASIVNRHGVNSGTDDGMSWLATRSAGSGRYVVSRVTPGDKVELSANPYYPEKPAQFARVEMRAVPDEGVRRLLLERGDVDIIDTNLVPAALVDRYRVLPGVRVASLPGGPLWSYLEMNNRRGVLTDARVRQAVAKSIDYDALRTKILKGNAVQMSGFIPPGTPGWRARLVAPKRDVAGAKALLRAAGHPDGVRLSMLISQLGPTAEFLQSNLRDAGIILTLERRSVSALQALTSSGQYDVIYNAWFMDSPDGVLMLKSLLGSENIGPTGTNVSRYSSAEADRLMNAAIAERRPEARAKILAQLERRLEADRPMVFIFNANPVVAHRADLAGVELDPNFPQYLPFERMRRVPKPS